MNKKIKTLTSLTGIFAAARRKKKKVVFTNGCFDILHRGHVDYLNKAKALGDILIVAINSDSSVRKLKGPNRPITAQGDRAEILAGLESVDFITIFDEDTPAALINKLRPDILVKGADWQKDKVVGKDIVESSGGKVVLIKYLKGYSTSNIIAKINKNG